MDKKERIEKYIQDRKKKQAPIVQFEDQSSVITETQYQSSILSRDSIQENNEWLAINNHKVLVYHEEMKKAM